MNANKFNILISQNDNPYVIDLINKSKNGDDHAFAEIVHLYQNKVTYIVKRYISEPSDVSDVCQEVFIKVFRYLDSFKGNSTFYTWLYSVTSSVAKNHLINLQKLNLVNRDDSFFTDYMDFAVDVHENINPQDILVSDETMSIVSDTINKLPKLLREIIILREIEGLSYEKIASVLKISKGTVRSRIYRARTIIEQNVNNSDTVLSLHKH
jgi:RNA polymerase sigma-70 factor (ECF subfamily)